MHITSNFAQPRTLGRKVSDEFTVPLCREHHRDLHRHGNEVAWWANLQIAPIEAADQLWQATRVDYDVSIPRKGPRQPHDKVTRGAGSQQSSSPSASLCKQPAR
jgi:hypothetical protein